MVLLPNGDVYNDDEFFSNKKNTMFCMLLIINIWLIFQGKVGERYFETNSNEFKSHKIVFQVKYCYFCE